MQKRLGQKTTLVRYDPCPGYIPPAMRLKKEKEAKKKQQELLQSHQQLYYGEVHDDCHTMAEDISMELEENDPPYLQTQTQSGHSDVDETNSQSHNEDYPTVVLDCANIGWAYGVDCFSATGVQIAYDFFSDFYVNVLGFLPAPYYKRRPKDGSRGNAIEQV